MPFPISCGFVSRTPTKRRYDQVIRARATKGDWICRVLLKSVSLLSGLAHNNCAQRTTKVLGHDAILSATCSEIRLTTALYFSSVSG